MSILRENIPLAVVTAVLVVAIIVLYREVASIKSTITQCPPPLEYNIASIVPSLPRDDATEMPVATEMTPETTSEPPALKPALKKRTTSSKMNTINEDEI
jgi:hypothetical protein